MNTVHTNYRYLLLPLLLLLLVPVRGHADVTLRASWDRNLVAPGSVVPITVEAPLNLARAEAVVGNERYPLIYDAYGRWLALVGISDKYKKNSLTVDVELYPRKSGSPYRLRADLALGEKEYGKKTQSLKVAKKMVNYSNSDLDRIRSDSRAAREARSERIPRRFWSGGFVMPVKGRLSTPFGMGRVLNGQRRSPHSGIDIAAPAGTPIGAANAGRVALAREMYLSGNTVIIDHGWGVSTLYAHMDRIDVKVGQLLRRGEQVGAVGSTGRSTGPHLHFGTYIRGARVDPQKLIEVTSVLN
jgi:murein DD-endopeptidase MepM/ murein hydrolase activator NlpD